jgi:hypothetical protein
MLLTRDTTHGAPDCLSDFLDFNDFSGYLNQEALVDLVDGVIPSPAFIHAVSVWGTRSNDVTSSTNKVTYIRRLHLLREGMTEPLPRFNAEEAIFEVNMQKHWATRHLVGRRFRSGLDRSIGHSWHRGGMKSQKNERNAD